MMSLRRLMQSKAKRVLNALDRSLAVVEFDYTGKLLAANRQFCQLMGYTEAELIGQHHSMFVDAAFAASPAYKEFWAKLRRGEFDRQEYLRIGKGGKQVWIQGTYSPVLSATGKVARIVKLATDTTAARLKNATFEANLAAISPGSGCRRIYAHRRDGRCQREHAPFAWAIASTRLSDGIHRMLVDSNFAASPEYQEFWRRLNEGQFVAGEFQRLGKGARDVWIQASYNPIFDLNNKVTSVVKFATNITGRVQAVAKVAAGLAELAGNNLEYRLDQPFEPAYEPVRSDYNASLERLEKTIVRVALSAATIQTGTAEIAASTNNMSRRIEEQAAGLEQTAAALDEITATVKQTCRGRARGCGRCLRRPFRQRHVQRGDDPSRKRHERDQRELGQDHPNHRDDG